MTTQAPAKKDAVAAKKAEVKDAPSTFTFKGVEFTVPPPLDLSDDVLDVIEDGGGERAIVRSIVGPEQWNKYKELRCTIREFNEFLDLVSSAAGFGEGGKLLRAARAIAAYSDELEADLLNHFGVDLLDLWRGRLSLRRVSVLVHALHLKMGQSALLASINEEASWSEDTYVLARISDALEVANYLFIKANSSKASDLEPPEPLPRPGQSEQPEEQFATGEEVAEFFAAFAQL